MSAKGYLDPEDIKYLIVHCSATPPDRDIGAKEINRWHLERGFNKIGYHHVIRRNGTPEAGRKPQEIGAHTKGYNDCSHGLCLVGGVNEDGKSDFNFTLAQILMLFSLATYYRVVNPEIKIIGHRDLNPDKDCPCFHVEELLSDVNAQLGEAAKQVMET